MVLLNWTKSADKMKASLTINQERFFHDQRINYSKASPDAYRAFGEVHSILQKCGLAKDLINLEICASRRSMAVLSASICTRETLKRLGVSEEKLTLLRSLARRRIRCSSAREKAAIAWAETVTRVAETRHPDEDYQAVAAKSDDDGTR